MAALAASSFAGVAVKVQAKRTVCRSAVVTKAGAYDEELMKNAKFIATPGKGILAMDESNATAGKRLESIGLSNTEENRLRYRQLLLATPGLGQYIAGAILFEETLYQSTKDGVKFVDHMNKVGIIPGIKVDKGLTPLPGSNGESICLGLDGLDKRCAEYYRAGARFCKWRTVVSIPAGPSELAVQESAHGLSRYGAMAQAAGLVPIIEPEILLDGDHDINVTQKVWERVWAHTFFQMAQCGVLYEGILLKPSMVTPGAECKTRASADQIAHYTIQSLKRRVPPAVPGINFLSGGQSEIEATQNLNNMNKEKNPWNVSFSYARALQNSVLKSWAGDDKNYVKAQQALLVRAKANADATTGKYAGEAANAEASKGMFEKGYVY